MNREVLAASEQGPIFMIDGEQVYINYDGSYDVLD